MTVTLESNKIACKMSHKSLNFKFAVALTDYEVIRFYKIQNNNMKLMSGGFSYNK